jgi:hypothetical protein
MHPHQQRVVEEKAALDYNREKLAAFMRGELFPKLDEPERRRLIRQAVHMQSYSEVLGERIGAFTE